MSGLSAREERREERRCVAARESSQDDDELLESEPSVCQVPERDRDPLSITSQVCDDMSRVQASEISPVLSSRERLVLSVFYVPR